MNLTVLILGFENIEMLRFLMTAIVCQGSHGHGKVENDWSWKSHGKVTWKSHGMHGKSHGKPKFGQIYFVDFVELRALKLFFNSFL